MKKIFKIIIYCSLMIACSVQGNNIQDRIDDIYESDNLIEHEEVLKLQDDKEINIIFIKATDTSNKEYLYCIDELKGNRKGNYKYSCSSSRLTPELGFQSLDESGELVGYDNNYYIGILYKSVNQIMYKGENIEFQRKEVELNGKDIIMTIWLMKYDYNQEIDINEFNIK